MVSGPPGPKSGFTSPMMTRPMMLTGERGKGSHCPMPVGREEITYQDVTGPPSKVNGQGHEGSHGTRDPPIVKRSLKRAYCRALRDM